MSFLTYFSSTIIHSTVQGLESGVGNFIVFFSTSARLLRAAGKPSEVKRSEREIPRDEGEAIEQRRSREAFHVPTAFLRSGYETA
jgi:hypothetical protein